MLTTCSTMRVLEPQKSGCTNAPFSDMRVNARGISAASRDEQRNKLVTTSVTEPVLG